MSEVLQVLEERGFIKQRTHQEPLSKQLEEPTTFYIGFDATADSLHVGHLLPIMVMAHMRRYGHRPIAVVGAAITMIGDPSGKTEMRQLLSAILFRLCPGHRGPDSGDTGLHPRPAGYSWSTMPTGCWS